MTSNIHLNCNNTTWPVWLLKHFLFFLSFSGVQKPITLDPRDCPSSDVTTLGNACFVLSSFFSFLGGENPTSSLRDVSTKWALESTPNNLKGQLCRDCPLAGATSRCWDGLFRRTVLSRSKWALEWTPNNNKDNCFVLLTREWGRLETRSPVALGCSLELSALGAWQAEGL